MRYDKELGYRGIEVPDSTTPTPFSSNEIRLLPFAPVPFTAATDRHMLPSERRQFVQTHRTCVFAYARRSDGPAMSVVYYVPTDGGELLVSTMAGRSKAIAVARNPKVSLCVLDERWPFAYLQVYADATVDNDPELAINVMMAVAERMTGQRVGEDAQPIVRAMAIKENRVVLRCRPYATFAQPQIQPNPKDQDESPQLVASNVPWNATDPY